MKHPIEAAVKRYQKGKAEDLFAENNDLRRKLANPRAWVRRWHDFCGEFAVYVTRNELCDALAARPAPRKERGR